jgi:hypothetical protein
MSSIIDTEFTEVAPEDLKYGDLTIIYSGRTKYEIPVDRHNISNYKQVLVNRLDELRNPNVLDRDIYTFYCLRRVNGDEPVNSFLREYYNAEDKLAYRAEVSDWDFKSQELARNSKRKILEEEAKAERKRLEEEAKDERKRREIEEMKRRYKYLYYETLKSFHILKCGETFTSELTTYHYEEISSGNMVSKDKKLWDHEEGLSIGEVRKKQDKDNAKRWKEEKEEIIRITSDKIRSNPPEEICLLDYLNLEPGLQDLYVKKSTYCYWLKTAIKKLEVVELAKQGVERAKQEEKQRIIAFVKQRFPSFRKATDPYIEKGTEIYILDGEQMKIAHICEEPRKVLRICHHSGEFYSNCLDTDGRIIDLSKQEYWIKNP